MAFELFERIRTVSGVLRYLVENDIKMPVRLTGGCSSLSSARFRRASQSAS